MKLIPTMPRPTTTTLLRLPIAMVVTVLQIAEGIAERNRGGITKEEKKERGNA